MSGPAGNRFNSLLAVQYHRHNKCKNAAKDIDVVGAIGISDFDLVGPLFLLEISNEVNIQGPPEVKYYNQSEGLNDTHPTC